jgi:predicted nucleotidyltransferase
MIASPADLAVDAIRDEMAQMAGLVPRSRWHLFGSITRDKRPVGDIDLLVVCENSENSADCARVRSALATVCAEFPIHLLLMTQAEEAEVNFIEGEGALEIPYPPITFAMGR